LPRFRSAHASKSKPSQPARNNIDARIVAHVTRGSGWTIAIAGDHAGIPAVAIADELARAFALEVHGAGGSPHPMRVQVGDASHDLRTLAHLRERFGGCNRPATILVPTSEGEIIVRSTDPAGFAIPSEQRFIRMALALAFTDVPLEVNWTEA